MELATWDWFLPRVANTKFFTWIRILLFILTNPDPVPDPTACSFFLILVSKLTIIPFFLLKFPVRVTRCHLFFCISLMSSIMFKKDKTISYILWRTRCGSARGCRWEGSCTPRWAGWSRPPCWRSSCPAALASCSSIKKRCNKTGLKFRKTKYSFVFSKKSSGKKTFKEFNNKNRETSEDIRVYRALFILYSKFFLWITISKC